MYIQKRNSRLKDANSGGPGQLVGRSTTLAKRDCVIVLAALLFQESGRNGVSYLRVGLFKNGENEHNSDNNARPSTTIFLMNVRLMNVLRKQHSGGCRQLLRDDEEVYKAWDIIETIISSFVFRNDGVNKTFLIQHQCLGMQLGSSLYDIIWKQTFKDSVNSHFNKVISIWFVKLKMWENVELENTDTIKMMKLYSPFPVETKELNNSIYLPFNVVPNF